MSLLDSCEFYDVVLEKCNAEIIDKLKKNFDIDPEDKVIKISKADINDLNIPVKAVDFYSYEFDDYSFYDILIELLGKHPYYLVFAKTCTWNGVSGYGIYSNILHTCMRPYEISLDLIEKGKDAIYCMEYSHDVPTGSPTYIIGLSYDDYDYLNSADFDDVKAFAESKF